jgi:hypothetical protein
MKNPISGFLINLGLLLFGSAMAFSGLMIQFNYHMGFHVETYTNDLVLGINYIGWSDIHKISIIFISMFMIFHTILHWKWYKTIIKKNLITKNKQVIVLSIIFIFVAITGYIPWLIKLTGGEDTTRKVFIEIHDKLALILFIYLVLHVAKRLKWFIITFKKLKIIKDKNTAHIAQ